MQMIDLSDIKDFHAARFMIYWLVATVIAVIVAYSIDPRKKLVWLRRCGSNLRGSFSNNPDDTPRQE